MQKTPILTLTAIAAGVLLAERMVTSSGAYATARGGAWGATVTAAKAGEAVAVDVLGTSIVTAGGVFAKDAPLAVGADGKVVAAETLDVIVGRALDASSGDGQRVQIFLIPNATPPSGT